MTIQRMEHVGIVVEDLEAAMAFFVELGLELQGKGQVEGGWVDRVVGLEGVRVEYAMVETPDGQGRLELVRFLSPRSGTATGTRRRTSWASAMSHSQSTTSTQPLPPCEPTAASSSARWRTTKTSFGSATSAARRGSSSSWRSGSAEGHQLEPVTPGVADEEATLAGDFGLVRPAHLDARRLERPGEAIERAALTQPRVPDGP